MYNNKVRVAGTYSYLRKLNPVHNTDIDAYILIESMQDINCIYVQDKHLCIRVGQKPILIEGNDYIGIGDKHKVEFLGKLHKIVSLKGEKYVALFRKW